MTDDEENNEEEEEQGDDEESSDDEPEEITNLANDFTPYWAESVKLADQEQKIMDSTPVVKIYISRQKRGTETDATSMPDDPYYNNSPTASNTDTEDSTDSEDDENTDSDNNN